MAVIEEAFHEATREEFRRFSVRVGALLGFVQRLAFLGHRSAAYERWAFASAMDWSYGVSKEADFACSYSSSRLISWRSRVHIYEGTRCRGAVM